MLECHSIPVMLALGMPLVEFILYVLFVGLNGCVPNVLGRFRISVPVYLGIEKLYNLKSADTLLS